MALRPFCKILLWAQQKIKNLFLKKKSVFFLFLSFAIFSFNIFTICCLLLYIFEIKIKKRQMAVSLGAGACLCSQFAYQSLLYNNKQLCWSQTKRCDFLKQQICMPQGCFRQHWATRTQTKALELQILEIYA